MKWAQSSSCSAFNVAVNLKRRLVHRMQRLVVNPIGRRLPVTMLETIGRKTGQPRRTAVGGKLVNNQFWMVSEHGDHSDYVRNIKADPTVRLRIRGRWRTGVAHLLTEDDPWLRLRSLPRLNSAGVRTMGTELLTIRLDLD
ncbi:nitroreductase/quinone reductase family protein [Mycobacterium sp.]|uniref:nitroreductase/quinone reductase family protein n=1 Tax=Mycobacterium sp. TaxID=1785 RepID=UPI003BADB4C1